MSAYRTLNVELGDRSYPIVIGSGLLAMPDLIKPYIRGRQLLVVTNTSVEPLYGAALRNMLATYEVAVESLPDGEEYKTLDTVNRVFTRLLREKFDRRCTIIALGGGVVGDIAGFAAACYQRGVEFVQVPTTLLAQVDSSVGGKTGVNHALGKNMVGAFYQPRCVIADTDTLSTLDDRQLAAGIAEVIKYGLIGDVGFFAWLEENVDRLVARDQGALIEAIEKSCAMKAAVVAADEREAGARALLNLGHTFGHAIETAMGYGRWLHGEAVAAGMCVAARISQSLGWLSVGDVQRIVSLIERAGLPTVPPSGLDVVEFVDLMAVDKKVMDGVQRLVLLEEIGKGIVYAELSQEDLKQHLTRELAH